MNVGEPRENFAQYSTDRVIPPTPSCPDGLRDYKPHLVTDQHEVGIGDMSPEHSSDVSYVFRHAPGTPLTRPRSCMPGEVGWGVPLLSDWSGPNTGQQIMLGTFRQMNEDRVTHEGTGAWYPGPSVCTPPGSAGYYKENIYSGRPGTSNIRYRRASSPWRPKREVTSSRSARGYRDRDLDRAESRH